MRKTGVKYIILLCVMIGFVMGCNRKAEEKSALAEQESSAKVSVTKGEISTELPVVEQTTEVAASMGVPEEKTRENPEIYQRSGGAGDYSIKYGGVCRSS